MLDVAGRPAFLHPPAGISFLTSRATRFVFGPAVGSRLSKHWRLNKSIVMLIYFDLHALSATVVEPSRDVEGVGRAVDEVGRAVDDSDLLLKLALA
eukprot:COSAG02_NODE_29965_length_559_cov_1.963043_1_plen_96_part_00